MLYLPFVLQCCSFGTIATQCLLELSRSNLQSQVLATFDIMRIVFWIPRDLSFEAILALLQTSSPFVTAYFNFGGHVLASLVAYVLWLLIWMC